MKQRLLAGQPIKGVVVGWVNAGLQRFQSEGTARFSAAALTCSGIFPSLVDRGYGFAKTIEIGERYIVRIPAQVLGECFLGTER